MNCDTLVRYDIDPLKTTKSLLGVSEVLSRPQVYLSFLHFSWQLEEASTHRSHFGGYATLSDDRCVCDQLGMLGRKRIHVHVISD